ncbi:complex I NDUFA9 subunit family protein [Elongatibacter sediminis]|uniref:Complex I NDUFA9 subunit family protein n=1 Tax=Elongatibacter sediminis TaxID=3119006 RepID=A0AAW9RN64_9GAMM
MRIVLLGATGFVGSHLLPQLSRRGHHCRVICRNRERARHLRLIPGVELVSGNAFDPDSLERALDGADAVINAVGILNERGRGGRGFHRAHVETVENLLSACRATGVRRFIQISAINAGKGDSHYLRSKGEAEQRLRVAGHVDETILRPSVIFGFGDSFFTRFAKLVRWLPVLPLACPQSRLQPVWVGDVAAAVGEVLVRPETVGEVLELVGPRVYTLRELVELSARLSGASCWIVGQPDPVSRIQAFIMDFVPGKPFSTDNYKSLQWDNVSDDNALPGLGIEPQPVRAIVSAYIGGSPRQRRLDRWRDLSRP